MPKHLKRPTIDSRTLQQGLTWTLLAFIILSIGSRLLQQSPDTVIGVVVLVSIGLLIGIIAWQHFQIRTLHKRLTRIERRSSKPEEIGRIKPISPASVSHFDSDQFFYRGQTKH